MISSLGTLSTATAHLTTVTHSGKSSSSIGGGAQGSSDVLTIAGVNATIITILTAIGVAYFGFFFQRMHAMKNELVELAEAVGRDPVGGAAALLPEGYNPHDPALRTALVQKMSSILVGWPEKFKTPIARVALAEGSEVSAEAQEQARANERAIHAQHLLRDISILLHTYPLAKEEGTRRINLVTMRGWLQDANALVEDVSRILELGGNYAKQLLQDATEQWRTSLEGARSAKTADAMSQAMNDHFDAEGNPEARYALFTARLRELRDEIKDVKLVFVRYESYAGQLPPRWRVWLLFVGAVIAFVTGVAYPLIEPHAERWILVAFPLFVYACGIIAAGIYLWRGYPKKSSDVAG